MSRIRSIKPEFWSSEQVMECSLTARLMFIGLWNFCDDAGRHPLAPKQIKALIFPGDDVTADDIRRMIGELSANGLLAVYSVDDKEYFQITGWQHQKIDRPQPARYPGPNDDHSSNARDGADDDSDGKGVEQTSKPSAQQQEAAREKFDELEAKLFDAAGIAGFRAERHPRLVDLSPILALIERGYDLDADILPVIRAKARNKTFSSWSFFTDAIIEATAAKRKIPMVEPAASTAAWPIEKWRPLVAHWRQTGNWNREALGPAPNEPGCKAPLELIKDAA